MPAAPVRRALLGPLRWLRGVGWRRRQARLVRAGWYDPAARSQAEAVFIGGCPRSGTTLLREILGRHSQIATGVETALLVPGFDTRRIAQRWQMDRRRLDAMARQCANLVEFAERFYAQMAADQGKRRWLDKTPYNSRVVSELLTCFPDSRFIHVIRDGRDVACSLRVHPREQLRRGRVVPVTTARPMAECALTWLEETSLALPYRGHPRYLEVRYEDLVADPARHTELVCDFLGEPFEAAMLEADPSLLPASLPARFLNNRNAAEPVSVSSVGRWRRETTLEERVRFADLAGELLIALGYEKDRGWVSEPDLRGAPGHAEPAPARTR